MEIIKISKEKACEIIIEGVPLGKFIVIYEDKVTFAIDNQTGDAWTENFESEKEAIDWLNQNNDEKLILESLKKNKLL